MNLSDKYLVAFIIMWNILAGAFWWKHMYGFALLWLGIEAQVALFEAMSYVYIHYTVTQTFGHVLKADPWSAVWLAAGMQLAWSLLLIHLMTQKWR